MSESLADPLALQAITKRFGRTLALENVSFRLRTGTVHALLGENGAGKTTLMRAAFGMTNVDTGTISIAGSAITLRSPVDAIERGLGMVHQHFTNVPAMTVAENVALGGRGRFAMARARQHVRDIGARTGLALNPDVRAGELPVGAQQRLEIVKALARDARVLILDEPTAVLAPAEAEELMRWLRDYANSGSAVVLITHKLGEALAIADDVTVLRHGRVAWSGYAHEATTQSLAAAMLGGEMALEGAASPQMVAGQLVARIHDGEILDERGARAAGGLTVEIRSGEILGIAAVEGAGQRELLRVLAGRRTLSHGHAELPRHVGWVPEDRHRDAMILGHSATENIALKGARERRGLMPWQAIANRTAALIRDFDVRGATPRDVVRGLSGGNQQKLILARELEGPPELLVVENPTRGLDIRAAYDVRARLRDAAAHGTAVIVYSSDLDEVLALATRVNVMYGGELRDVGGDRGAAGRAMLGLG